MLKTTFCPNCGKPYDVSLGECPVCARQRAEEGAAADKSSKRITPKRKSIKDRVRAVIPVSEPEEPTVLMDAEAIAAAQAAAKRMAEASRTSEKTPEEERKAGPEKEAPKAPAAEDPKPQEAIEPMEETAGSGNRKLIAGIVVLAVALILLGAGILSVVSSGSNNSGADTPLGVVEQDRNENNPVEDDNQQEQDTQKQEQTGDQGQEEGGTDEPEKQPENQNQAGAIPTTPDTTEPSEPVSPDTDETGGADTGDTGNQEEPETPDIPDTQPEETVPGTEPDNGGEAEPDTPSNEGENTAANAGGAEELVNA